MASEFNIKEYALGLLERQIKKSGGEISVERDFAFFSYTHHLKGRYDLAEIENDKVIKAYYVCDYRDYLKRPNAIIKQLRLYQDSGPIEVFLACLVLPSDLVVLSLQQVEEEISNKLIFVDSLSDFYRKSHKIKTGGIDDVILFYRGQPNNKFLPIPGIFRATNSVLLLLLR